MTHNYEFSKTSEMNRASALAEKLTRNQLELFVDVLICTDYSIYVKHRSHLASRFQGSSVLVDKDMIRNDIKSYYMGIMNDVCKTSFVAYCFQNFFWLTVFQILRKGQQALQ
jgi:hypothetical protein